MKRSSSVAIAVVIVIVLAVGGYALFHKSNKPSNASSTSNSTKSSAPAVNNSVVITKTNATLGQYLADPSDKTLYTYGSDTNGVSNCTGSCLSTWPAYVAPGSTANLPTGISTIKRTDNGQMQYTYNGLPLYYFASDSSGQVTGDGVNNFHVAKPASSSSSSNTTNSSSSSSSSSYYP